MKNPMYFFAYGLLMNSFCMKERCPNAKALCPAILKDSRITERKYADIDPEPGSQVCGVVYAITPDDRKRLDEYAAELEVYTATEVEAVFGDNTFRALAYVMTPKGKAACDEIPFEYDYIEKCSRGAEHHMVPNMYQYVNVIAYGPFMTGGEHDIYVKNAVSITPCTITGMLFESGYGYPIYFPMGNSPIQAEHLLIPRKDWEKVHPEDGETESFKERFIVARAPDGSTLGGWILHTTELTPRMKQIESGCWRDWRKLDYDMIVFSMDSGGCDAHLVVDFARNMVACELTRMSPGDPAENKHGICQLSRFWKKELKAAFRECQFQRWQDMYYSNGEQDPKWYVELKKNGKTVRFMFGRNVFPLNWDTFESVVRLCSRLVREEDDSPEPSQAQPASGNDAAPASGKAPAQDVAPVIQENVPETAQETAQETAHPASSDTDQPDLFPPASAGHEAADDATSERNDLLSDVFEDDLFDEPNLLENPPDTVEGWVERILYEPGLMDKDNCPSDQFTLEQWKELIVAWPQLLQYDPPEALRDCVTESDFSLWTGHEVCMAIFMDGQWLSDLFPLDHISQEDYDDYFGADGFSGPDDYWDVIPDYFPFGFPPGIKHPFPRPNRKKQD